MVANVHKPGFKDWKELVGETKNVLENAQFAADKLVLSYSKDASTHLYVYSLDGKELNEIKLPTVGRASFSGERGQKECFYSFASFTVPGAIYQYDMAQTRVLFTPNLRLSSALTNIPQSKCSLIAKTEHVFQCF